MQLSAPIFKLRRAAKAMARTGSMPLHAALDHVAVSEGFSGWSHLIKAMRDASPAQTALAQLDPGDMLLLAARPGHGKTLLALDMALAVAQSGGHAMVFTLDFTEQDVDHALRQQTNHVGPWPAGLAVDASDEICADYIIAQTLNMPPSLIVIDYLQLLDQKRAHPPLADQVTALKAHVRATGSILVAISQIDRRFDPALARMPGPTDIRLPNPLDIGLFDKTCFLHDGRIRMGRAA